MWNYNVFFGSYSFVTLLLNIILLQLSFVMYSYIPCSLLCSISLDKFTLGSHFIISLEWGFCLFFCYCCFCLFLFLFLFCFYLGEAVSCFWLYCLIPRILVPQSGIEPGPTAVKTLSLNHWTTREFPYFALFSLLQRM